MAKLSRNQRHKARQRRTLSLLKREYRKLFAEHQNVRLLLLAILRNEANVAGTLDSGINISEDAVKDTLANFQTYGWKSARQENGSITATLVDLKPKGVSQEDSVKIRVLDDEGPEADPADPGPDDDDIADMQAVAETDATALTDGQ